MSTRAIAPVFERLPEDHPMQRHASAATLPVTIADQVWRALEQHAGPLAGLEIAAAAEPPTYGLLTRLIAACPDVHHALRCLERYYPVLSDGTTHHVEASPAGTEVSIDFRRPYAVDAIIEGFAVAVVVAFLRKQALGSLGIRAVELQSSVSRACAAQYAAFFGVPVRSQAPRTRLVWAHHDTRAPLRGRDAELYAWLADRAARGHATMDARGSTSERVTELLRELGPRTPSLHELATRLGFSTRTLRRRLDGDGTSLRALVDSVRRDLAEQRLAESGSIEEVARELGFADRSAFRRAFRRWTGVAPGPFRDSLTAPPPRG